MICMLQIWTDIDQPWRTWRTRRITMTANGHERRMTLNVTNDHKWPMPMPCSSDRLRTPAPNHPLAQQHSTFAHRFWEHLGTLSSVFGLSCESCASDFALLGSCQTSQFGWHPQQFETNEIHKTQDNFPLRPRTGKGLINVDSASNKNIFEGFWRSMIEVKDSTNQSFNQVTQLCLLPLAMICMLQV